MGKAKGGDCSEACDYCIDLVQGKEEKLEFLMDDGDYVVATGNWLFTWGSIPSLSRQIYHFGSAHTVP